MQDKQRQKVDYSGSLLPQIQTNVRGRNIYQQVQKGQRTIDNTEKVNTRGLSKAAEGITAWLQKRDTNKAKEAYAEGGAEAVAEGLNSGKFGSFEITQAFAGEHIGKSLGEALSARYMEDEDVDKLTTDPESYATQLFADEMGKISSDPDVVAAARGVFDRYKSQFVQATQTFQRSAIRETNEQLFMDNLAENMLKVTNDGDIDTASAKEYLADTAQSLFGLGLSGKEVKSIMQRSLEELILADPMLKDDIIELSKATDLTMPGQQNKSTLHSLEFENKLTVTASEKQYRDDREADREGRLTEKKQKANFNSLSVDFQSWLLDNAETRSTALDSAKLEEFRRRAVGSGANALNWLDNQLGSHDERLDKIRLGNKIQDVDTTSFDYKVVTNKLWKGELSLQDVDIQSQALQTQGRGLEAKLLLNEVSKFMTDGKQILSKTRTFLTNTQTELLSPMVSRLFRAEGGDEAALTGTTSELRTRIQTEVADFISNKVREEYIKNPEADESELFELIKGKAESYIAAREGRKQEIEAKLSDKLVDPTATQIDETAATSTTTPTKEQQYQQNLTSLTKKIGVKDMSSLMSELPVGEWMQPVTQKLGKPLQTSADADEALELYENKMQASYKSARTWYQRWEQSGPPSIGSFYRKYQEAQAEGNRLKTLVDNLTEFKARAGEIELVKETIKWQAEGKSFVPQRVISIIQTEPDVTKADIMLSDSLPKHPVCGGPLYFQQMLTEYSAAEDEAAKASTLLGKLLDILEVDSTEDFLEYHYKQYGIDIPQPDEKPTQTEEKGN